MSGSGTRILRIPAVVTGALPDSTSACTAQAIRSRLAMLGNVPDDHPVISTRNGTFISPNSLRRQLRAVLASAGLPEDLDLSDITPHTFRKTVDTTIDQAASNDLAAELLGHASKEAPRPSTFSPRNA